MHRHILYNGEIRDAREALLAPGQVGFMNGWGVFSTLRVTQGVLFAFERHYARLQHDSALLHVPFAYSLEDLRNSLLSLVEANAAAEATLRVAVVRNRGGIFEGPDLKSDCDLIAFTAPLVHWGSGVHLHYVPNARFGASPFSGIKTTSWAQNLTWYEQAHQQGFDEVILLNEYGEVSECTSANIFAITKNAVWTPPLATSGCLPGVTRAILLEEIRLSGLKISEHELTPSQLEACDQVFITSTTRDLLPVLAVDGTPLNQDESALDRLNTAFGQYRQSYVKAGRTELVVS